MIELDIIEYALKGAREDYRELEKMKKELEKKENEHPPKTLLTEFLVHYPKAELNSMGIPNIVPCELGLVKASPNCMAGSCKECWNTPINESKE